jgi:AbrB family looped-hinge helix DNA binding protein
MANVVGDRYQITIDKQVREELGLKPGDLAIERVEDGRLVIEFISRPHRESLLGILKAHATKPIVPIEDWEAVKDRAWAARSAEIMEALRDDSERHRTPGRSRRRPSDP